MKSKWTRRFFFTVATFVALWLAVPGSPGRAVAAKAHKFAIILPGPIEDADYNFRGYQVSQDIKTGIMQQRSPFSKIRPYFPSSAVLPTEKSTKSAKRCHLGHPFHLKSRCIGGFLHFGAQ
jgi:hypothetical protein